MLTKAYRRYAAFGLVFLATQLYVGSWILLTISSAGEFEGIPKSNLLDDESQPAILAATGANIEGSSRRDNLPARSSAVQDSAAPHVTFTPRAWPGTPASSDNAEAADAGRATPDHMSEHIPPFLQEYVRFHQREVHAVRSDPAGASNNISFLIYACRPGHCGGLGDRFKGIVTALYLAAVTRRVFLLQHPGFPLASLLSPYHLDWDTLARSLPPYDHRAERHSINVLNPPPRYMINSSLDRYWTTLDGEALVSDVARSRTRHLYIVINVAGWDEVLDAPGAARAVADTQAAVPGVPGLPPRGPRFAWAWHVLFRPTHVMEAHLATLASRLRVPMDGTPWVGVHLRVGASAGFPDLMRTSTFCDMRTGARTFAGCAARITQLVSWPPFVTRPGPIDPSNVTVFLASDNEDAADMVARALVQVHGHAERAVVYVDGQVTHSRDAQVAAEGQVSPHDPSDPTVRALTELLLLSHATCVVMDGSSGFSGVAVLMSRDLATGTRCHTVHAGVAVEKCGGTEDLWGMTFREFAAGGAEDGDVPVAGSAFGKDMWQVPMKNTIVSCSAIVRHHGQLCPTKLPVEVALAADVTGHPLATVLANLWDASTLQGHLSALMQDLPNCRIDIMFARKGDPPRFVPPQASSGTLHISLTLHAGSRGQQRELVELVETQETQIRQLLSRFLLGRAGSDFNVTLTSAFEVAVGDDEDDLQSVGDRPNQF